MLNYRTFVQRTYVRFLSPQFRIPKKGDFPKIKYPYFRTNSVFRTFGKYTPGIKFERRKIMDTNELKLIMNSLYGFTATQLVQQISAINALERTLEDIKKGASWQSLDLCLDSAISTLETIKNTPGINSERSEKSTTLNIDYIRSLSVEDLAIKIKNCIYICEEGECAKCPFDNNDYGCTLQGIKEWLLSERSEKEEN